jgi:DNA polymerase-1
MMEASKPSDDFLKKATYLVDSSSYIFRAYYAIRQGLTAADGTPTHATFGFAQMTLSLISEFRPAHCVFVWDQKEKGYRHEIFPEYKANRGPPPEDLGVQLLNSRKLLGYLGLPQLDKAGFEADDIIATLVRSNPQHPFVVVTGDKDLLQLVGPNVWCLDTMKMKWSNQAEALEKFGVLPAQISQVQALCGDSVDNVPGAPGVGPKTATELIRYYGNLDSVLEQAEHRWKSQELTPKSKEDPLKGKRLESIATHLEKVRISYQLVCLHEKVPVVVDPESFKQASVDLEVLKNFCNSLGFTKMSDKFSILFAKNSEIRKNDTPHAENQEPVPAPPVSTSSFQFEAHCLESLEQFKKLLGDHVDATTICLDTETKSLENRQSGNIVGLSLAFTPSHGYYVPLAHQHGMNLPLRETLETLKFFLQDAPQLKQAIFQNAKFDLHVFRSEGLEIPAHLVVEDTMIASFVLDPTQAHGMDDLSLRYLDGYRPMSFEEVLGKQEDFSQIPVAEASFYAAEDAAVTLALWNVLNPLLQQNKALLKVYENLDRPLIRVLFEMESAGVNLDRNRLSELSVEFHDELKHIEKRALNSLRNSGVEVPPDFNMASPKQIGVILFEKLGLPVIKKTKTGASTDVSVLEELAGSHDFPKALLEIRELSKLISTYVDSLPQLIDSKTKRIHTDFAQTIAATGRLASNHPNLQNIPIRSERGRKIREAFCAAPGCLLVSADYSQIELRLLAHASQDQHLIQAFNEGADIHRRTAALVLKKPENQIDDNDRRMAKTINFGIIYGQTAFGLSKQLGISRGEAQAFIDAYFLTYPGIKTYMEESVKNARETGYAETFSGRRRPLKDIASKNVPLRLFAERVAINSPLQGTAADLIKAAMLKCSEQVGSQISEARMLLQVHDELLFEVPEAKAKDLLKLISQVMENQGLLAENGVPNFRVPLKVDGGLGRHWGEL